MPNNTEAPWLWDAENNIDVIWQYDLGVILVLQRLALGNEQCDFQPRLSLSRIAEQVHYNHALLCGFLDGEGSRREPDGNISFTDETYCQRLATHLAPILRLLPARAILADANNNVEAVVAHVQALAVTLRTVTEDGQYIVFEVLLQLLKWPSLRAYTTSIVAAKSMVLMHVAGPCRGIASATSKSRGASIYLDGTDESRFLQLQAVGGTSSHGEPRHLGSAEDATSDSARNRRRYSGFQVARASHADEFKPHFKLDPSQ